MTLLRVAYNNVGSGGHSADPGRLTAALDQHEVDLVMLAEMSEEADIRRALARAGFDLYGPALPGGPATPVAWRASRWDVITRHSPVRQAATDVGPGTGPDHGKTKRQNTVWLRDRLTGRHVIASSLHLYAGQRWALPPWGNKRARLSRRILADSLDYLDRWGAALAVVGVDGNARPGSRTWAAVNGRDWTSADMLTGRPIVTHPPHGQIDRILIRRRRRGVNLLGYRHTTGPARARFVRAYTLDVGSDHLMLVAEFDVTPRLGWVPKP